MSGYFLGIDVSKGYADFILLNEQKEIVIKNFQLDDTFRGHNQLFPILENFIEENPEAKIFAGLESTGGYEDNWYTYIKELQYDLPIQISRLNPNGVHHTRKAELDGNVTDKISAQAIAYHLINRLPDIEFNQEDPYSSYNDIFTHIRMLTKQKTQLINQFSSLMYKVHPELISYCKSGMSQWVLKLVREYPTAEHLSRGHMSKIASIPYITEERAEELRERAKRSVASATDTEIGELIQDIAQETLMHIDKIKKWKTKLKEKCDLPEVEILRSITGITTYSGIGLLLNIGSIEKFSHKKCLSSHWGIHPEIKVSGDGKKKPKMSKKGRSVPRELLWQAVMSAIGNDCYINDRYNYYVEEKGKSPMSAVGILMHKLTRIIYGMLKNGTKYNPELDKRNRTGEHLEKNKKGSGKKRRYQKYDPEAPISGRENKKRKERLETQDAKASYAGSSNPPFSHKKSKQ